MGVPVVTMNSGGMAELVEDGKTGGLVPQPTPEAVADTVRRCLDPTVYPTLKEHCARVGETIMDVHEYCELLICQYELLMKR